MGSFKKKKLRNLLCYLIVLRGPRVEGPTEEELGYHAAQGPHVDGLAERQAQDDLWSPAKRWVGWGRVEGGDEWLKVSRFSCEKKNDTADLEQREKKTAHAETVRGALFHTFCVLMESSPM